MLPGALPCSTHGTICASGSKHAGPTPPELTRLVARDISEALAINPQLDIQGFLRLEYEGRVPLAVIMKDGRVVSTGDTPPPDELVREIRNRLNAVPESFMRGRPGRGRGMGSRQPGAEGQPPPPRLGGPGGRRGGAAGVVFVNGVVEGVVIAMPRSTSVRVNSRR